MIKPSSVSGTRRRTCVEQAAHRLDNCLLQYAQLLLLNGRARPRSSNRTVRCHFYVVRGSSRTFSSEATLCDDMLCITTPACDAMPGTDDSVTFSTHNRAAALNGTERERAQAPDADFAVQLHSRLCKHAIYLHYCQIDHCPSASTALPCRMVFDTPVKRTCAKHSNARIMHREDALPSSNTHSSPPMLTQSLLAHTSVRVTALLLLLIPSHHGLWSVRRCALRERLTDVLSPSSVSLSSSSVSEAADLLKEDDRIDDDETVSYSYAPCGERGYGQNVHTHKAGRKPRRRTSQVVDTLCVAIEPFIDAVLQEFALLDLLLSMYPKLQELWVQRAWLVRTLAEQQHVLTSRLNACSGTCNHVLIDEPNTTKTTHTSATSDTSPRCCCRICSLLSSSLPCESAGYKRLSWRCIWQALRHHDTVVFTVAAAQHRLNYNAWTYRRDVLSSWQRTIAQELSMARDFLSRHHGDTSASSYLLFLLHRATAAAAAAVATAATKMPSRQQQQHDKDQQQTRQCEHEREHGHVEGELPQSLWRALMRFTQHELRYRADRGHECMWCLRYGLVCWALSNDASCCTAHCTDNPVGAVPGHSLQPLSGWTVQDELEWVSCYVDGYVENCVHTCAYEHVDKGNKDTDTSTHRQSNSICRCCCCDKDCAHGVCLLAPVNGTKIEWSVEGSGTPALSSYLACRYGLQLLEMLRR